MLEDYHTPFIPEKLTLAKRLAQCLNPQLPVGIHRKALYVYTKIFDNLKLRGDSAWSSDLGIYSVGIFAFFKHCSVQVKNQPKNKARDDFKPFSKD